MAFDFTPFQLQAQKIIAHTQSELATLRTGRASVQLLDTVTVEAYGTRMKLNELANITVPDANLLVISPWDKSVMATIERGIN